jgi:hypothetical protein
MISDLKTCDSKLKLPKAAPPKEKPPTPPDAASSSAARAEEADVLRGISFEIREKKK